MKLLLGPFVFVAGLTIAANILALAFVWLMPANDGDILVVGGLIGTAVCFALVWFVRKSLGYVVWFALISHVSLLTGIDAHVAFHNAFGTQSALKATFSFLFVVFLITVLLRKNYLERPGQ